MQRLDSFASAIPFFGETRMFKYFTRACVAAVLILGTPLATIQAGTVTSGSFTIQSDANTLATALGPGAPSTAVVAQLDAGNDSGLIYTPSLLGGFGSFTPLPTGAPAATSVVNIPPGDGESGFFKVTFTLPGVLTSANLSGAGNVDDLGRVFLNGNPITPSLLASGTLDEYDSVPFSTSNLSLFKPGQNVLLVADDNAGGGPSAAAFYATVTYNQPVSVPEPAGLTLLCVAGAGCVLRAWRQKRVG
jgi:hypothetical protein